VPWITLSRDGAHNDDGIAGSLVILDEEKKPFASWRCCSNKNDSAVARWYPGCVRRLRCVAGEMGETYLAARTELPRLAGNGVNDSRRHRAYSPEVS
jgi:hypothetical protein